MEQTYIAQNGVQAALWKKDVSTDKEQEQIDFGLGEESPIKVLLVNFDENVYNNKGCLKSFRSGCLKKAEKVNNSTIIKASGMKLYNRFCVLPQIRKVVGNAQAEDLHSLVEAFTKDL